MPHSTKRLRRDSDLISASEIACFAYCPEQWRLHYGQGLPSQNRAVLDAGTRYHRRKEAAERLVGGLLAVGLLLAAFGLVALLWLIWGSH